MLWNTAERYGLISRILHWGIALLFFAQFILGLGMEEWAEGDKALEAQLLDLHSSLGITLALLALIRILLGRRQIQPEYPPTMSPHERLAADAMKKALNLAILLTAAFGYLSMVSDGKTPMWFGLPMPPLTAEDEPLHEFTEEGHELLAFFLMGLALLHMAAALKHHFMDKDDTLRKMIGR